MWTSDLYIEMKRIFCVQSTVQYLPTAMLDLHGIGYIIVKVYYLCNKTNK